MGHQGELNIPEKSSLANHLRIIFVRIFKFMKIYRYEGMIKNSKGMGLLRVSFVFRKIWRWRETAPFLWLATLC